MKKVLILIFIVSILLCVLCACDGSEYSSMWWVKKLYYPCEDVDIALICTNTMYIEEGKLVTKIYLVTSYEYHSQRFVKIAYIKDKDGIQRDDIWDIRRYDVGDF